MDLAAKTALICGASQGIGKACAYALAARGANLILLARNKDALEKVRMEIPNASLHKTLALDLSDKELLVKTIQAEIHKPISLLVCNSGGPPSGKLHEADTDLMMKAFQQHVVANQELARLLIPGMKELKFGRIITILSTSVKTPLPNLGVSNMVRAAVASWAKTLSLELAPWGITVNNVLPGYTQTSRLESLMQNRAQHLHKSFSDIEKEWIASIPAGRFAKPEEIAAAVAFLASPEASYVNGINLPVDGGRTPSL